LRKFNDIEKALSEAKIAFERDVPLAKLTSFGIGGPARLLALPDTAEKTSRALAVLVDKDVLVFPIGRGTNILAADEGFEGALIKATNAEIAHIEGNSFRAGAMAGLDSFVDTTAKSGYGSAIGLAGIPGSVGGAIAMNAGAWGVSTGELIESVIAFDMTGDEISFDPTKMFSYRTFAMRGRAIIHSAMFKLSDESTPDELSGKIADIRAQRAKTQPLDKRSAGCAFKNPEGDHAGRLIDVAGLKGMAVGGAEVSKLHANFIVVREGTAARDVLKLIEIVRDRIRREFNIELELEIIKLGFGN